MNRSEIRRHLSKTQTGIDGLLTCDADSANGLMNTDYLYRYALLRVRNPQVAEDLVQETLLAALRSRDGFRGQVSERSWHCANALRSIGLKRGPRENLTSALACEIFGLMGFTLDFELTGKSGCRCVRNHW